MADARQTSEGKWVISGITFASTGNVPNGLEVPITLTYPNSDPVDVTIKKQKQVVQTNWATPLGQRIDTTKIGCTSQTVPYGDKRYKITKVNWGQVVPYVPERHYELELTPTSTALTSSVGSVEFKADFVEYEGDVEKSRNDISTEADWIYDSDITENSLNEFEFNNTGETQATVVIKAAYEGLESNEARVTVPAQAHHEHTYKLELTPTSTALTSSVGSVEFKVDYVEYEDDIEIARNDISTEAEWEYDSDITENSLNEFEFNNTGATQATVVIKATYEDLESNEARVTVPAAHHEYTYALELTPTSTALTSSVGSVEFKVDYVEYEDDIEIARNDISTEAEWEYDSDITDHNLNEFEFDNTGATQATVVIKAAYEGLESNEARVTVPAQAHHEHTYALELTPTSTALTSSVGSVEFKVDYVEYEDDIEIARNDISTEADWIYDSDITENSLNEFEFDNTGETQATVVIKATYEDLESNEARVTVPAQESHTLTIEPTSTPLPDNIGQVTFVVKYDGEPINGASLAVECSSQYSILENYVVSFWNNTGQDDEATVTATYNGLTSNEATVLIPRLHPFVIIPDTKTIMWNGSVSFITEYDGVDVTDDTTFTVTASTEIGDIARIVDNNVLEANNTGNTRTVYVVGTYNGKTVEAEVVIEEHAESWIVLIPKDGEITYNGEQEYAAYLYTQYYGDDEPTSRDITYDSQTTFSINEGDPAFFKHGTKNVVVGNNPLPEPAFAGVTVTYNGLSKSEILSIGQFEPQNGVSFNTLIPPYDVEHPESSANCYSITFVTNDEYTNRDDVQWNTEVHFTYNWTNPNDASQHHDEMDYSLTGIGDQVPTPDPDDPDGRRQTVTFPSLGVNGSITDISYTTVTAYAE